MSFVHAPAGLNTVEQVTSWCPICNPKPTALSNTGPKVCRHGALIETCVRCAKVSTHYGVCGHGASSTESCAYCEASRQALKAAHR